MFLDLETTGLDPYVDEITEMAYVFDDDCGRQFYTEHTRLPSTYILQHMDYVSRILPAVKVPLEHALTVMVNDCSVVTEQGRIRLFLVGANPAFDHGFIRHAFRRVMRNLPLPYFFRLIDIEAYVAGALGLTEPPALKEIRTLLGIAGANPLPHSAMADACEVKIAWDKLQGRPR